MSFGSADRDEAPDREAVETRDERGFDVWNEVPLVPQTTGMSCWAAAAAMLVGWRERLAVDPGEVAIGAGRWREFRNGLHPVDVAQLAAHWRLTVLDEDVMEDVDRLRRALETYGPLWVGEASPGLHSIVITGIAGDGTRGGTAVRVNDPWPVGTGERYVLTVDTLRVNFEQASRLTGGRAHVLHSGGRRRGRSRNWSTARRTSHRSGPIKTEGGEIMASRVIESSHQEEYESVFGRVSLESEALGVSAGSRYLDTSRTTPNPLATHGGTGENLYLAWNALPDTLSGIDVVVHLHGYTVEDPTRAMFETKVRMSGIDLGRRSRPTLAIVPRGRKITADEYAQAKRQGRKPNAGRYTFPALLAGNGAGLEALIRYALAVFAREALGGKPAPPIARYILTAHSGGGAPLDELLSNYASRAACNPHEVHVFDAFYGGVDGISAWARKTISADAACVGKPDELARSGGACRVLYRPDTRPRSMALARLFPIRPPLAAAYRVEATGVGHGDIPRVFGPALLTDAKADLVLVPSRGQSADALDWDGASAFAADDDARRYLAADASGRQSLASSVKTWILDTARSGIELLGDAAKRRRFLTDVNWEQQHFSGRGPRTAESEALFNEMARVVTERRVPSSIKYHNVDAVVQAVSNNPGAKLFPEAKDAFERMRQAARTDGVTLTIVSSWRSQSQQDAAKKANKNPAALAQGVSAHTYGLAIDLAMSAGGVRVTETSTKSMPNMVAMYRSAVYKWMALNARQFGWFPYRREPWHWEYNPDGFKARYESSGRTGGALAYGAPTALIEQYRTPPDSAPIAAQPFSVEDLGDESVTAYGANDEYPGSVH